jgi:glycosyltransferase involved in cell wall biosynthesis
LLYYIGYKYWQRLVLKKAKELHNRHNFNIVHQLTQISFREPGYLWKLGIPFFWGPTGGTSTFPRSFYKTLSIQSQILDRIRTISAFFQFKFTPRIRMANIKAANIYTFSKADEIRFLRRATGHVKIMLDVGTYRSLSENIDNNPGKFALQGIWCGRLDEYKAPKILLEALSLSRHTRERITLQIIGSGPLERTLIEYADHLKLNNIEWVRKISHQEVFARMSKADFFVHTSIREATSSVIPEALSTGLPVICHDAFGMSIAVDETCGIKVPLVSPEQSAAGFHEAMERLLMNRHLLKELKIGSKKRSTVLSWDNMVQTISDDYIKVANERSEKNIK